MGVDDAHLLDELSATLVQQLVVRGAATVLVTVRTNESAPDAVAALWKDAHVERIELRPLTEAETRTLLEAILGGPVDSGGAAQMWRLAGGNGLGIAEPVGTGVSHHRVDRAVHQPADRLGCGRQVQFVAISSWRDNPWWVAGGSSMIAVWVTRRRDAQTCSPSLSTTHDPTRRCAGTNGPRWSGS